MKSQSSGVIDQLRSLERVFEAALSRVENDELEQNLIPSELRDTVVRGRFSPALAEAYSNLPYGEEYSRCMTFLSTVCASLSAMQVWELTSDKEEVVLQIYRFTTGPVRECAHLIEQGASEIGVQVERMTQRLHELVSRVREVNLLKDEHKL